MLQQHEIELRVRYQETDPMGFLHHANYFTYFEIGRTELLRAAGGNYRQMEADGLLVVVVKAECTFPPPGPLRRPAAAPHHRRPRDPGQDRAPVRAIPRRRVSGRRRTSRWPFWTARARSSRCRSGWGRVDRSWAQPRFRNRVARATNKYAAPAMRMITGPLGRFDG